MPDVTKVSGNGMDNVCSGTYEIYREGVFEAFYNPQNNLFVKIITNRETYYISGADDAATREIVDILKNPESYKNKGIRQIKGIIFEGTPGNGKTLFAKALAEEANVNFIATRGADFQSAMMSVGASKIKMLFKKARKYRPCIIFIDEFDSIGERRYYAGTGVDKENNRIVTAMLNEMDGFKSEDGVLVIAATNSFNSLDPALIRPGRFDLKYNISNPDLSTRKQLIDLYTKNKVLADNVNKDKLAGMFEGLSCSAIETILNEASMVALLENSEKISLDNIIEAGKKTNCKLVDI
jgi:cell division protease FtsH